MADPPHSITIMKIYLNLVDKQKNIGHIYQPKNVITKTYADRPHKAVLFGIVIMFRLCHTHVTIYNEVPFKLRFTSLTNVVQSYLCISLH